VHTFKNPGVGCKKFIPIQSNSTYACTIIPLIVSETQKNFKISKIPSVGIPESGFQYFNKVMRYLFFNHLYDF
jgi:hypothetical protein